MLKKVKKFLYVVFASTIAVPIANNLPKIGDWFVSLSGEVFIDFINNRYIQAATLEHTNYSFYLFVLIFIVITALWIPVFQTAIKNLRNIEEKQAKEPSEKVQKYLISGSLIYVSGLLFYVFIQIAGEVIVLNAITDFKQHTRIIKPYISAKKYSMIYSKWSQMRSLEDYNKLYTQMVKISKKNKLKLYKNRAY